MGSTKVITSQLPFKIPHPKGPYTAHLRTLVPKTIPSVVFGTRVLNRAVHAPFGPDTI